MYILSDTEFLSVRDSLLVFTMAVQLRSATSPFLKKEHRKWKSTKKGSSSDSYVDIAALFLPEQIGTERIAMGQMLLFTIFL